MFSSTFLVQARFFRLAGDGSRKYLRRLSDDTDTTDDRDNATDEYGFVWMNDLTLPNDATQPRTVSLTAEIAAIDLGSGPGGLTELSIFDPVADPASLEPDGLSASPGSLVEEARDIIAPRDGETSRLDFPDQDAHALLDRWVAQLGRNLTRLNRLIFTAAEAQVATCLLACLLFAVLNGLQLTFVAPALGDAAATVVMAALAILAAVAMIGAVLVTRDHCRIVTHFCKTACSASSAVIINNYAPRQDAIIRELDSHFDALVKVCLVSPADEAGLETRVRNSVSLIFRARRRLNRNREYLRLAMRAVGMSHLTRVSEDQLAYIGWSWQIGNLAFGFVPRIAVWLGVLSLLAAAALLPVALAVAPLLHGVSSDSLRTLWASPKVPFAAGQAGMGLGLFILAAGLILAAHARILRPPLTPDDVRQISKEAALRQVKSARDARVTTRFVELLVLLFFRLRKEEDRQH